MSALPPPQPTPVVQQNSGGGGGVAGEGGGGNALQSGKWCAGGPLFRAGGGHPRGRGFGFWCGLWGGGGGGGVRGGEGEKKRLGGA